MTIGVGAYLEAVQAGLAEVLRDELGEAQEDDGTPIDTRIEELRRYSRAVQVQLDASEQRLQS